MSDPIKKYDITKYLIDGEPNFKPQLKTFVKTGDYDGYWKYHELNTWYEIEEMFVKSWKEAGGEFENYTDKRGWGQKWQENNDKIDEKWHKLVGIDGRGRRFHCFYGDINQAISDLGGKFYNERIKDKDNIEREREREREQICLNCQGNTTNDKFCEDNCLNDYFEKHFELYQVLIGNNTNKTGDVGIICKVCEEEVVENVGLGWGMSGNSKTKIKAIEHIPNCLGERKCAGCSQKSSSWQGRDNKWYCPNCFGKLDDDKDKKLIEFCEKIFEKCPELKEVQGFYIKNNVGTNNPNWCVYTPLLLDKINKQEAVELKSILQNLASQKSRYGSWIPTSKVNLKDQSQRKSIGIGKDGNTPNPELIKELDKIIEKGEKQNDKGNNKKLQPDLKIFVSALNQLQQFFIANNIHSITNQNGNLVIVFNTNTNTNTTPPSQTITDKELSETSTLMEPEQKSMWKKFKEYLKKTGKNKINKQELEAEIQNLKLLRKLKNQLQKPL